MVFMQKHQKKSNDRVPTKDLCQTPPYALEPILPYLDGAIWEPACGEGYLAKGLIEQGFIVQQTDILYGYDFLKWECGVYDMIVTNPPFSLKYKFLERCYEFDAPFALLMPVEVLGAKTAQIMFQKHGLEVMLLNKRIDFKMPNKGWAGTAWFPTAWFCHKLLPRTVMYGRINKSKVV